MATRRNKDIYNSLYKKVQPLLHPNGGYACTYCGVKGTVTDHCPPISRVDDYRALGVPKEEYITINCCADCNNILERSLQRNFKQRFELLKERLSEQLQDKVANKTWSKAELEELGPLLRSKVVSIQDSHKLLKARVEYYDGLRDYILNN